MAGHLRRTPVSVRRQRGSTDVRFWSGSGGGRSGSWVGRRGTGGRLSLDVGLTRLPTNPVFTAELVRNFGAVCLNLLLVLRKKYESPLTNAEEEID